MANPSLSKVRMTPKAVDPVWQAVCDEAQVVADSDPSMTTFVHANILSRGSLEEAVIHRLANRLHHQFAR